MKINDMEDSIIQDIEAIKKEIKKFEKAKQLTEEYKNAKDYCSSIAWFRICLESFLKIALGIGGLKYRIPYEDIFAGNWFFCDEEYLQKHNKKKDLIRNLDKTLFALPGESKAPKKDKLLNPQYRSLRTHLGLNCEPNLIDKAFDESSNNTHHNIIDYSFKQYYDYRNKYIKAIYQDFAILFHYLKTHHPEQMRQDIELINALRNCVESTQKEIKTIEENIEGITKSFDDYQSNISINRNYLMLDSTIQELIKVSEASRNEVSQCKTKINEKAALYKEFTIDVVGPFASGKSTLINQIRHVISLEEDSELDNQGVDMEFYFENLKFREIEPTFRKEGWLFSCDDGFADFIICVFSSDHFNSKENQEICKHLRNLNKPYQCVFNMKGLLMEDYDKCKKLLKTDLDGSLGFSDEIFMFDFSLLDETKDNTIDREAFSHLLNVIKKVIKTTALSYRRLCLNEFVEQTIFGQYIVQNKLLDTIKQKKEELGSIFYNYKEDLERLQKNHLKKIDDRSKENGIVGRLKSAFNYSENSTLMQEFQDDYNKLSKRYDGIIKDTLSGFAVSNELSVRTNICTVIDAAVITKIMGATIAPIGVFMGFGLLFANYFVKSIKNQYKTSAKKIGQDFDQTKKIVENNVNEIISLLQQLSLKCLKSHKIIVRSLLNNYFEELGYDQNDVKKMVIDVARIPGKYILIVSDSKEYFSCEMMSELKQSFGMEKILLLGSNEEPNSEIPQEIIEQIRY